uniref:CASTOR1 N-terminal domain-containing protein n=1 Tax=Oncorhynchus mykiss TaxID=8022 RepID=A0A8K9X1X7_ONCMY
MKIWITLKVVSIAKEGIQSCTHGLIKLAFLPSKARLPEQNRTEQDRTEQVGSE